MKAILKFWQWIKSFFINTPPPSGLEVELKTRSYIADKDQWISYKDYKGKVKLRKIIRDSAMKLNNFNKLGYQANREDLVLAYEIGGLNLVAKTVHTKLQEIIDKQNAHLELMKLTIRERVKNATQL